jgi:hypothetical protein
VRGWAQRRWAVTPSIIPAASCAALRWNRAKRAPPRPTTPLPNPIAASATLRWSTTWRTSCWPPPAPAASPAASCPCPAAPTLGPTPPSPSGQRRRSTLRRGTARGRRTARASSATCCSRGERGGGGGASVCASLSYGLTPAPRFCSTRAAASSCARRCCVRPCLWGATDALRSPPPCPSHPVASWTSAGRQRASRCWPIRATLASFPRPICSATAHCPGLCRRRCCWRCRRCSRCLGGGPGAWCVLPRASGPVCSPTQPCMPRARSLSLAGLCMLPCTKGPWQPATTAVYAT